LSSSFAALSSLHQITLSTTNKGKKNKHNYARARSRGPKENENPKLRNLPGHWLILVASLPVESPGKKINSAK
jgi:hypothetical protein